MDWISATGFEPTITPPHEILLRVAVAAVLGGLIGIEREATRQHAGLRTHILIAAAAALYTILTLEIFQSTTDDGGRSDPVRAVEAVTAGIAFLGAGAIFRQGGGVHGLTTGAGMWLAGAVGMASALGYYLIAVAGAVLAVMVLAALRLLEPREAKDPSAQNGAD